jgi:glycosyltransferase involved in cell wall biosynthesis
MKSTGVRALVYGHANMNLIDGSAVWVQSAVQVFAGAGCDVTLLLKASVETDRLLEPLLKHERVTIRRPFEERLLRNVRPDRQDMTPLQAIAVIRQLDEEERYDIIVVRGLQVARALAADSRYNNRLWTYLTDIPQTLDTMSQDDIDDLGRIAEASRFLLCQTEELRSFLETSIPQACGRTTWFPPVVPERGFELSGPAQEDDAPFRLVYMGKYAPDWMTLEMTELPTRLAERGHKVEVHMIGDKVHTSLDLPEYQTLMQDALTQATGVVWHGGVSRSSAWRIAAGCDVGLSWRHDRLDESLELSTKLLEYGQLGLPVILNRTPMHEVLLGADYPLFADEPDVVDVLDAALQDESLRRVAAQRCAATVDAYTLDRAVERTRAVLAEAFPVVPELAHRRRPLRVLVASHDFKFFTRLQDYLSALPGVELKVDLWPALNEHDEQQSKRLNRWADVVICEWCGPNAAWYSKHKRPGQRLIVRLHRFEIYRRYPAAVKIDAVDQVVCVSPHYAGLTRTRTGWPAEKVVVIPNWVDMRQLDRPKLTDSEYTLGFIGVAPMARKRLSLALDVLADLRGRDPRFQLAIKTKMPWDYPWIWAEPVEQQLTSEALDRIHHEPALQGAVVFDRFGPDVGNFLRRVGFVLSTSDDESFHLSPAEGMASGAVPAILNWPGSETIYSSRWLHESVADMAQSIWDATTSGEWHKLCREAQDEVRTAFALPVVGAQWATILTQDIGQSPATLAAVPPPRSGDGSDAAGDADDRELRAHH